MIPDEGAEGVLIATGGEFGGWSLFVKDNHLHYVHNYLKMAEYDVVSNVAIPSGRHQLAVTFEPTSSSRKPDYSIGTVKLFVDGKQVGELEDVKSAGQYSSVTGYGLQIGRNAFTPVSHEYESPFSFTGHLERIVIKVTK